MRFLGVALLLAAGVAGAQTKTITVGAKGADFTTIQAAVNAAPETRVYLAGSDGWNPETVK